MWDARRLEQPRWPAAAAAAALGADRGISSGGGSGIEPGSSEQQQQQQQEAGQQQQLDIAADEEDPLGTHSFRMVVAYDGTVYSGWQLQPRAPTVQLHVERALTTVLREPREALGVSAAGRTDAGVHAAGQVVQFRTRRPEAVDPARLPLKLNSLLPHDIRVKWMAATAPDFNVTCSATGKIYIYEIDTGPSHDPLTFRTRAHCGRRRLDAGAMRAGAALLEGVHDFTQFSNNAPERLRRNPVKDLRRLEIVEVDGGLRLEVEGSGFLYKQVRAVESVCVCVCACIDLYVRVCGEGLHACLFVRDREELSWPNLCLAVFPPLAPPPETTTTSSTAPPPPPPPPSSSKRSATWSARSSPSARARWASRTLRGASRSAAASRRVSFVPPPPQLLFPPHPPAMVCIALPCSLSHQPPPPSPPTTQTAPQAPAATGAATTSRPPRGCAFTACTTRPQSTTPPRCSTPSCRTTNGAGCSCASPGSRRSRSRGRVGSRNAAVGALCWSALRW